MRPNENFRKYFPEVDIPKERGDDCRSSCLKAGAYMVINQTIKEVGLDKKLEDIFGNKTAGMILDFAAYSIITGSNVAQYYPDYAYNHPLFTPDMKIYSDSTVSDFFRTTSETQRQSFLDRGYFSKDNLKYMDSNGFGFIIMVKGCKEFISEQVRKQMGTFENDWANQIAEFGVYGKTVLTFVYPVDTKKGMFISSIVPEKIDAKEAIGLYKNRDVSEKVFRADKSYLGNSSLRVASEEAASTKIFIGFIALIIRCKIYTALKNKAKGLIKKPNYLTVPAAMRELEKIEMIQQQDKAYRLDHAVTKTQKVILSAFHIDPAHVKYKVNFISEVMNGRN